MPGERRWRLTMGLWSGLAVATMTAVALILHQMRQHEEAPAMGERASVTEPSASAIEAYLSHIRAGTAAYRAQRYMDARRAFEAAIALRPAEPPPYRYLAEIYWREGKPEQAAQAVRTLAAAMSDAYAVDEVGRVYEESGMPGLARQAYQEAIRLDPRFPSARYNLGRIYLNTGDLQRGIAEMQAVIRLHPDFPEAHQALGMAYTEQGRLEDAIAHLKRALAIQPELTVVRNHLGRLYLAQGRLQEAIEVFQSLVEHAPDVAEARHNLAVAYARQGLQEMAVAEFKEALRRRPDLHAARSDLATLLLEMRRPQEAIDLLGDALVASSSGSGQLDQRTTIDLRYRLATAFRAAGRPQEAIRELQAVLRAEPAHGSAHAHLGLLYYQTQQFALAWQHARQAEALGLPVAELITALRRVSVEPR